MVTKRIEAAVDEGQDLYWVLEAADLAVRTSTGGYTLRAVTALMDNGTVRSRKIYQTCDRSRAQEIHRELAARGVEVDDGALPMLEKLA